MAVSPAFDKGDAKKPILSDIPTTAAEKPMSAHPLEKLRRRNLRIHHDASMQDIQATYERATEFLEKVKSANLSEIEMKNVLLLIEDIQQVLRDITLEPANIKVDLNKINKLLDELFSRLPEK